VVSRQLLDAGGRMLGGRGSCRAVVGIWLPRRHLGSSSCGGSAGALPSLGFCFCVHDRGPH